jgi:hypothetical protein
MTVYDKLSLGCLRHTVQPMLVDAEVPESARSMVIGHTKEENETKRKALVDRNSQCYTRTLMTTVKVKRCL